MLQQPGAREAFGFGTGKKAKFVFLQNRNLSFLFILFNGLDYRTLRQVTKPVCGGLFKGI